MTPRCRNGHELTDENWGLRANGTRYCRQCNKLMNRKTRRLRPKVRLQHNGGFNPCTPDCKACEQERLQIQELSKRPAPLSKIRNSPRLPTGTR